MHLFGWIQLILFVGLLLILTKPMGKYLVQVLEPDGKTILDPVLRPFEKLFYKALRIDPKEEQTWKEYAFSLLTFNLIGVLFTYVILRIQHLLPLNPEHFGPLSDHLAFNTAVSFVTQTNWQSYAGEATMSYFSQMVALVFQNFASAAVALSVAAALVRGIVRNSANTIGNFWATVIRSILYLLLPLSLIFSLFLVSQGAIQNFSAYKKTETQSIVQGPIASQIAIKILGSNGGGYTAANAAHPYENPTPLSNFFQTVAIVLIPSGMTYYLGRMAKNQRHGWSLWCAMMSLLLIGCLACWKAEAVGNPHIEAMGIEPGNMEGKEVRFGIFNSALWATATSSTSCGAVNSMHDSYTPIGGLVPLLNIMLGCIIFGGAGAGLFGILVYVIITIFLAGLMIGRTPDYLGKKIEVYDVKACVIYLATAALGILGFAAWAVVSKWGLAGLGNTGPHGLSEILYAFSQASSNNGSAFAGLKTNTYWFNTTLGVAILIGRYLMLIPVMALAGNFAKKKAIPVTKGCFPVSGLLFTALLAATIVIIGVLVFFPAVSLGPIIEHFIMMETNKLYG